MTKLEIGKIVVSIRSDLHNSANYYFINVRVRDNDMNIIALSHRCACLFIGLFLCQVSTGLCADDELAERYRQYMQAVQAGLAAINIQDYVKAIDHYTKAIDQSPFVAMHYYYRGLAFHKSGEHEKAIADFTNVLVLEPSMSAALVFRGLSHLARGEEQQALLDYTSALSRNPKDPAIHNNLAWLYAVAKDETVHDNAKALRHAIKASVLSDDGNAEILDTLARAYFINGNVREALDTQKKAVHLQPAKVSFTEHLREYEQALAQARTGSASP
jgi:tetratricopeptide (TPR) repeat protein